MSKTGFTYCPDCGRHVGPGREAFVAHREKEHPPAPKVIAVPGIESQEKVGSPGGGR